MATLRLDERIFATTVLILFLSQIPNTIVPSVDAQTYHSVEISNFAFHPQNITIITGGTVTWTNNDSVVYTLWFVTTENQTYLLSDPIAPGESWSHTFSEAVDLQYYCFERLWITGFIHIVVSVGGVWVTVDKLALLAPYIALASTILVATATTAIYVKRRKEKQ